MQTLYTVSTLETQAEPGEPAAILKRHFEHTRLLLMYFTYFLTEVARYAETDAHTRASKHLPTASDLNVNTKIAGNEVLWKIRDEASFRQCMGKDKPEQFLDKELVRKIYQDLVASPEYAKYIAIPERTRKEESAIMEFILSGLMLPNEVFLSHLEENFSNLEDDGEMVILLVQGMLQKPGTANFNEIITPDKQEFAQQLLRTVLEKDKYLEGLIIPKLKNWDPDRIALLDMIIMKMGVSEFLYFETIPPKVTINEYIDLAKEYSTQQSGQFVNGILDNIHKELVQQGKMHKIDFKKA